MTLFRPAWSSMASHRCWLDPRTLWRLASGCRACSWGTSSCCVLWDGSTWLSPIFALCVERHPVDTNTVRPVLNLPQTDAKKKKQGLTNIQLTHALLKWEVGVAIWCGWQMIWMLKVLNTIILLSWSAPSSHWQQLPTTLRVAALHVLVFKLNIKRLIILIVQYENMQTEICHHCIKV